MSNKQRIVIIGATSAIAEYCSRLWVRDKAVDLILVGRDAVRIERVAADLRVRSSQSRVEVVQAKFLDADSIQATVNAIAASGPLDIVLIAHGALPDQNMCQSDLSVCRETLEVNGISPVLYAEAFAMHMAKAGHGTLALIGSVAGDRGRKSNYVYGAAKGMVDRYAQGLQHRFAGTAVQIVLIKPGPTDTPMTAHLKGQGARLAPVESVAKKIVYAIQQGKSVVYAPGRWQLIMWVIRHIPATIFNRLNI
jgi:short-subunit dehydrogenase